MNADTPGDPLPDPPEDGENALVEVRDQAGTLIGRFHDTGPPPAPRGCVIDGIWPSDEEIDRRGREGRSYTVAEVDAFIEQLRIKYPSATHLATPAADG